MSAASPAGADGRSPLQTLGAWLAAAIALWPSLSFGFLRDDWLLLWAHADATSAPSGATGVFWRPVARVYWWIVAPTADPRLAHALQVLIALAGLWAFWLLLRRLPATRAGAPWALALLATHAALLELRVWAAASNGLLALSLACWSLLAWSHRRMALAALLLLLAIFARADAVLVLLLGCCLAPRLPVRRLVVALAAGALGLVWTLREAGSGFALDPTAAGRALRLLLLPWGPALPGALAWVLTFCSGVLGLLGLRLLRSAAWTSRWAAACCLVIAGATLACAALPWGVAGRYLSFAVLALALLLALFPPRRWWARAALALVLAAHLASDLAGHTLHDLQARSRVETALFRAAVALAPRCEQPVVLLDAPPMGWTNSAADAENVLAAAWHCDPQVLLLTGAPVGAGEFALRYADGAWLSPGAATD